MFWLPQGVQNLNRIQIGEHGNLVLCAISSKTDNTRRGNSLINRASILKQLAANGINNINMPVNQYFYNLPRYKFIISPEGNGVDTHRTYESLIAGCIPIVESSIMMKRKYHGCPILWTTDYSEITPQFLNTQYERMKNSVFDFSRLFMSYWDSEQQQLIKQRGNYWCLKLAGKKWYN